jgi:hypothetical protein
MSNKSNSPYGVSFFIRFGVLLAFLLIVGGALAYDRLVLVPNGEDAVKKVLEASKDPRADRSTIEAAAGREPNECETIGSYSVEHWEFGRILPNLEGHKVSAAFKIDGKLAEIYSGGLKDEQRAALTRASTKEQQTPIGSSETL